MSDVFGEIGELKRALENTKYLIKKCNDETKAREQVAAANAHAHAAAIQEHEATDETTTGVEETVICENPNELVDEKPISL